MEEELAAVRHTEAAIDEGGTGPRRRRSRMEENVTLVTYTDTIGIG